MEAARGPRIRLRSNLVALTLMAFDLLPRALVRTEAYRRCRRLLSKNPERFARTPDPERRPESWPGRRLVTPETDLVVEGFPGSASSFASNCLRAAVGQAMTVESHFHHTVQLKRAAAFGIPVIVVVREPEDAWSSLKSKEPALFNAVIAIRWILYHAYVLRKLRSFHVFLFDDVVQDVDVLRRCPAVQRRAMGKIEHRVDYRRASSRRRRIAVSGLLMRVLRRRAESIYRNIEQQISE